MVADHQGFQHQGGIKRLDLYISVIVQDGGTAYFLAGDTSYNEELMLAGLLDGVSADEQVTSATLDAIRRFTQSRPAVYLPTHDPKAAGRLAKREVAAVSAAPLASARA